MTDQQFARLIEAADKAAEALVKTIESGAQQVAVSIDRHATNTLHWTIAATQRQQAAQLADALDYIVERSSERPNESLPDVITATERRQLRHAAALLRKL